MKSPTIRPEFMLRCLDLASLGRHRVGNGAMVGALLVRQDKIIAEGFHGDYGMPHAERILLECFRESVEPDDVLYVNLEPCCHHGKTHPCTDIVIQKGVRHVAYGMIDPDDRVSGKGIRALKEAKISVHGPMERAPCEYFNKGFISVRTKSRPYVTIKMAQDRAQSISHDDGSPMKITSKEQDAWSHSYLRSRHDAILVGVGTIISDNPLLNIRFDQKKSFAHSIGLNGISNNLQNFIEPIRVILDPALRIPLDAKVVTDDQRSRTLLCVNTLEHKKQEEKLRELKNQGIQILELKGKDGIFAWEDLWEGFIDKGITSVLVEGGRKTWDAFTKAGFCDELVTLLG